MTGAIAVLFNVTQLHRLIDPIVQQLDGVIYSIFERVTNDALNLIIEQDEATPVITSPKR